MNKTTRYLFLAGVIYLFLVSIKLMGSAFKAFGREFAEQLISFTSDPFVALFIGILATAVVQSSSVTTSVVVVLTASGALTLSNAIPIIMGANIGTSITNTIVSLGHLRKKKEFRKAFGVATIHDVFNFIVVIVLFPIEILFHPLEKLATIIAGAFSSSSTSLVFNSPLDYIVAPLTDLIKAHIGAGVMLALAFVLLFGSLHLIVRLMKPIVSTSFKEKANQHIFASPSKTLTLGFLLTVLVQSSSISSSLIVPVVGLGVVSLRRIFPYILGSNIGTTITAFLAALATGSPAALIVSLEHVLFNLAGSILIYPIRSVPINISLYLSHIATKSKFIPISYIISIFYLLPLAIIFIF